MPVGTYGSVKAMTSQNLHDINVKIILVLRKGALFTLFRTIQLPFFDCIIAWQILLLIKNHVAFTVPSWKTYQFSLYPKSISPLTPIRPSRHWRTLHRTRFWWWNEPICRTWLVLAQRDGMAILRRTSNLCRPRCGTRCRCICAIPCRQEPNGCCCWRTRTVSKRIQLRCICCQTHSQAQILCHC